MNNIISDNALQDKKQFANNKKLSYKEILEYKFMPKKDITRKYIQFALQKQLITNKQANGYLDINTGIKKVGFVDCGNHLSFASDYDMVEKYLYEAWFCRWRFCHMCMWRLSLKRSFAGSIVMQSLAKEGYRFLVLTLTIPNVAKDDLSESIVTLQEGWRRQSKRKKYKEYIVGGIRAVEVTYNKNANTYHPHLHLLLVVKSSYFDCVRKGSDGNRTYEYINMIPQSEWQKDWQCAVRVPRAEQVYIKAVPDTAFGLQRAILEISKYMVKISDMGHSADVFEGFYNGLRGKRLYNPFGLYSDVYNELQSVLQAKDIGNSKFAEFVEERKPVDWFWKIVATYAANGYKTTKFKLSDDEKIDIQKKYLMNSMCDIPELDENTLIES